MRPSTWILTTCTWTCERGKSTTSLQQPTIRQHPICHTVDTWWTGSPMLASSAGFMLALFMLVSCSWTKSSVLETFLGDSGSSWQLPALVSPPNTRRLRNTVLRSPIFFISPNSATLDTLHSPFGRGNLRYSDISAGGSGLSQPFTWWVTFFPRAHALRVIPGRDGLLLKRSPGMSRSTPTFTAT